MRIIFAFVVLLLTLQSCGSAADANADKKPVSGRRQVDSTCTNTRVITSDIDTIDILQCGSYSTTNGAIEGFTPDLLLVISERNNEYVLSGKLEAIDGKLEVHSINDPKNIIATRFGGNARQWADKMVSVIRR